MGLPFEPELEEALRGRFTKALSPVYLVEDIQKGGRRPGQSRNHVFDYFDGTRLIISRERSRELGACLHVSVSFQPGMSITGEELLRTVVEKVNGLRGDVPGLIRAFVSREGIVHFIFPEPSMVTKGIVMPPNPSWN